MALRIRVKLGIALLISKARLLCRQVFIQVCLSYFSMLVVLSRRAVLFAVVLLFFAQFAFSASYYVRAGAVGARNGSDWNNAWSDLNQISWGPIQPGDTIYIAGGTYTANLVVGASGITGSPITIKRATAAENSTNPGWQSGYDSLVDVNNAQINLIGRNNIVIDGAVYGGIRIRQSGNNYIITIGSNENITLRNLELIGPGYGVCLRAQGIHTDSNNPTGSNYTFARLKIHDFFTVGIRLGDFNNVTVEDSELYNIGPTTTTGCSWHYDHIAAFNGSSPGEQTAGRNITVRNSKFWQEEDNDGDPDLGFGVSFSHSNGLINVYNNEFYNIDEAVSEFSDQFFDLERLNVYGNTFVGNRVAIRLTAARSNQYISNNIFCSPENLFLDTNTRAAYPTAVLLLDEVDV